MKSPENVLTQHHSNFRRKIAVCVIVLTPMYVFADLSPALDRGSISIGELLTNPKIDVGISTPYGNVQTGDVSLGKQKLPRIKAEFIFFDNQGISFDSYKYKRSYTAGFHEVGNIAGNSITADGNASLDVQLDYSKLAYKWWLGSENTVLGIGLGAAYYKLNLRAAADLTVGNATTSLTENYSDQAFAPLLDLGLRHAFSQDLRLYADISGMQKSKGRLNVDIYNEAIGIEWFPIKNMAAVFQYGVRSG